MSKFKQRKYLEKYADGGLIRVLKNRQAILDKAEANAITPTAPPAMPMGAAPPTQPEADMRVPVGPVNQMVTQQAMKVKQDADAATKSLGLRHMANGGPVNWKFRGMDEGQREGMHTHDISRAGGRIPPAFMPAAARMIQAARGIPPTPVGVGLAAMTHVADADAASTPVTEHLGNESSRRQLLTQYPDQVSRGLRGYAEGGEVDPEDEADLIRGLALKGKTVEGEDLYGMPWHQPYKTGSLRGTGDLHTKPQLREMRTRVRGEVRDNARERARFYEQAQPKKYASGGEIDFGQGSAFHGGFGRDSSIPLTSERVQSKPWRGPPRLERIGSTSDLVGMSDYGGGVRTPASGANSGVGIAPTTNSMGRTQLSQNSPANMSVSKPEMPTIGGPAVNPLDNSAKGYKFDPSQRSFDPNKPAPTVGETMPTGFVGAKVNPKTGYPMAADGGEVPMSRWGGPTEDNISTNKYGLRTESLPHYAQGGEIMDAVPKAVRGDPAVGALTRAGAAGSEALAYSGRPELAIPKPLLDIARREHIMARQRAMTNAIPGGTQFAPAAAGIVGAARSLMQSPEERNQFAESVGLNKTPLQSSIADAWRTGANVGNAMTAGLAGAVGQYGSDAVNKVRGLRSQRMRGYADGGAVTQWDPSMGVNIPEGGYAIMTQRGTGQKIIFDRGGYKGSRKGLKKYSAQEFKDKMGWADGGSIPHGVVTKDYFQEVDQQMSNGGGVDEGEIYGEGGPTDDKQPILASPGEFIVPEDVARKHKRQLRKMVKDEHTPVKNEGLRGGYAGGMDVLPPDWDSWEQSAKDLYNRTKTSAQQMRDTLAQRGRPMLQRGTEAFEKAWPRGVEAWQQGQAAGQEAVQNVVPKIKTGLRNAARYGRSAYARSQAAVQNAARAATRTTTPIAEALNPQAPVWKRVGNSIVDRTKQAGQGLKDMFTGTKRTGMDAFQRAQAALQSPTKPYPGQPNTFERFPNAQGEMQTLQNKKWASATPEPGAVEPPLGQRPIPRTYAPRGFEEALKDSPLTKASPQRALDIEQLATRGTDAAGKVRDFTKLQKLGQLGSRIASSKPAQILGKVAAPLTLGETARESFGTDTEEYRKRFGLNSARPEDAGYGTQWMAKPGFWSDVAVRGLGAASDLGNVMTGTLAGNLYRDKQEQPAVAAKPPEKPGLGFAKDPGPKDASQRENRGIPIPARDGLRQGEDLPAFDAQGRPIDATELAPIQGGGYISGGGRLKKYTKDAMPLPSGVTDTTSPEVLAADKARRADWTAQSAAIDAKNQASDEAENRRIDTMVERNAMNSAAYNRREGLRNRNVGQYMGGLQDQEMGEQAAQRRSLGDIATQNRAAEMARVKAQADAQKYNTDTQAAVSKYSTDAQMVRAEMESARAREVALAGMREKHGADFDNFLEKSSQTINPATGQPDLAASSEKRKEFMKWAYAPAVNNSKFLEQFGGAKSIDDLPKSQWAPLWEAFQTKRSIVKDVQPDQSDPPLEGLATDVGLRKIKAMDWWDPSYSNQRNNISARQALWGASGGWNPFVAPEDRWTAQLGTQGSKVQNMTLRDAQWNTPSKRMEIIAMLRRAGKNQEADELAKLAYGDRGRGLR